MTCEVCPFAGCSDCESKGGADGIHNSRSPRWRGNPRQYQIEAQRIYALSRDKSVMPWVIKRERVKARLSWPHDPYYDLRAFQRSGIEDPESLGLCDAIAKPLRPEYALDQEAS